MSAPDKSRKSHSIACALCGTKFIPAHGQLRVRWAVSWCESADGLLCPACHYAAEQIGKGIENSLGEGLPPLGCCAFGSDIMKLSTSVSEQEWSKRRGSESFHRWNATHNPELYTDAERATLLGSDS